MFEFKFEVDDDHHVVHLRPIAEMPIGIAMLNEYASEVEQMRATFKWAACSPDDYELLKLMPAGQLEELMKVWQDDDNVTVGESVASPTSSKTTAGRSKQTS